MTRAADAVHQRHPVWMAGSGMGGRARCFEDLRYHACYLADALANERPELFADYVRWLDGFLERQGVPTEYLRRTLVALDEALRMALGEQHGAVAAVLATGYAALEEQGW